MSMKKTNYCSLIHPLCVMFCCALQASDGLVQENKRNSETGCSIVEGMEFSRHGAKQKGGTKKNNLTEKKTKS
jgi:hypothetical protein